MTEQPNGVMFAPKWVLSGMPKSGAHLLACYLLAIARPQNDPKGLIESYWAGTFLDMSWTNRWAPIKQSLYKLGRVQDQHFLMAHVGYKPFVEQFLYHLGVSMVFVRRDLRDVAVSQAHHIWDGDDKVLLHPGRDEFKALGSFENVLKAVIEGLDPYPGIFDRWKLYETWMHIPWVLQCRFEDLVGDDREGQAERILEYGLERLSGIWDFEVRLAPEGAQILTSAMAESSRDTGKSPTFRRGKSGGWRDEFTPELIDLFRKLDDGCMERAGYEW